MSDQAAVEGRAFARHLVGAEPPPDLLARYRDATARLFPAPPEAVDAAVLAFAVRHAWAVGPLDAATAFFRPTGRLRAKLLVMAAILETSPRFADRFLPAPGGRVATVARLAVVGIAAVARVAVGAVLYGIIRARA